MDKTIFKERRQRLLDRLGNDAILVPSGKERLRNGDVHYRYRPGSDFYYLTGFEEPEAALLLSPAAKTPATLFVREKDEKKEQWEGHRLGPEASRDALLVDAAHPIDSLAEKLDDLVAPATNLYTRIGEEASFDRIVLDALCRFRRKHLKDGTHPINILDLSTLLHEMRLLKDGQEIESLERAADISAAAHLRAMALALPGVRESQIQAAIEEAFLAAGSERVGYPTIVASGENATVLHYIENRRFLEEGDLVLVDAGCEIDYLSADITRTFPVSGRFTKPQEEIYRLVLSAQEEAIAQVVAGRPWDRVHQRALSILVQGLIDLGAVEGSLSENLEKKDYKSFFPHGTSHWLGMDVHDVGCYKPGGNARPLEPGMVLTVEPGLYFQPEKTPDRLADYRGIGIRIEDDILVTDRGPRILTSAAPKQMDELLAACSKSG